VIQIYETKTLHLEIVASKHITGNMH